MVETIGTQLGMVDVIMVNGCSDGDQVSTGVMYAGVGVGVGIQVGVGGDGNL
jgi:hypothetical protein